MLEEELDFMDRDAFDQIDQTFVRRMSFQVALAATEKAKLNVLRLLAPSPEEEEEEDDEEEHEEAHEEEEHEEEHHHKTTLEQTKPMDKKDDQPPSKEPQPEPPQWKQHHFPQPTTGTTTEQQIQQQIQARNQLKEVLYNETVVERALAALENNKMNCEELDQKEREEAILLEQKHLQIQRQVEQNLQQQQDLDRTTGWREKIRMNAAEKQQRKQGDVFWGLDLLNQQQQEDHHRRQELQHMNREETQQCSRNDTFWGIDHCALEAQQKAEERSRLENLTFMRQQEVEQCSGMDAFWGLDANRKQKAIEKRRKLLKYTPSLNHEKNTHPSTGTSKGEQLMVLNELDAMVNEEKQQRKHGDRFWGIDVTYINAGLRIVKFRKQLIQKRLNKQWGAMKMTEMNKYLTWTLLAKKRTEDLKLQQRLNEEKARRDYMNTFFNPAPRLSENAVLSPLSPQSSSLSPLLPHRSYTFGMSSNSLYTPKMGSTREQHNAMVPVGRPAIASMTPSMTSSMTSSMARTRKRRKRNKRNDHLPSLEDSRRSSGTYDGDRSALKTIRNSLVLSQKKVSMLLLNKHIHQAAKRERKKFRKLTLPPVGLSVESRRRRRVVSGKVGKLNGKIPLSVQHQRAAAMASAAAAEEEVWQGLESYASLTPMKVYRDEEETDPGIKSGTKFNTKKKKMHKKKKKTVKKETKRKKKKGTKRDDEGVVGRQGTLNMFPELQEDEFFNFEANQFYDEEKENHRNVTQQTQHSNCSDWFS